MSEENGRDRFYLKTPWGEMGAAGTLTVFTLIVGGMIGLGLYHHHLLATQIAESHSLQMAEIKDMREESRKQSALTALYICVSTLTKEEQKDFRIYGMYCGSYEANEEVRKVIRPEAKK